MTNDRAPDLAGLCAEVADELDEVTSTSEGGGTTYARGGAIFARVAGGKLDVRLPAEIARAALRTPDTGPDPDDRGWDQPIGEVQVTHVEDFLELFA